LSPETAQSNGAGLLLPLYTGASARHAGLGRSV